MSDVPSALSIGDLARYLYAQGYDLIANLGTGSFAEVWQVRERASGNDFAWKQLRPEWEQDRTARKLLENEAEVGRAVRSRYVVQVLRAQVDRTPRFLVLEWHPGRPLEALLQEQPRLPMPQALWIARQCAQGLADLLTAGFSHGDVKPPNVLIGEHGDVRLIDLAFAQRVRGPGGHELTRSREVLTGTPEYMAPESLQRFDTSGSAKDIYSLGIMLFRMLTGRLPFHGETTADLLRQQREAKPPPLRHFAADVHREVAEFVEMLLAKQPIRRPHTLEWLVDQLLNLELATLPHRAVG